MSPFEHPCDIGTIDYSMVDQGRLWCKVCGKQWIFISGHWSPRPLVKRKPK